MGVESTNPGQSFKSIFKNTGTGGSGGGSSGPPGVAEFSVEAFNTSGGSPTTTPYPDLSNDDVKKFTTEGYYVLTIPSDSEPLTLEMWAWGAGGAPSNGPGPGNGGAGGGVRGRKTFTAPTTITFLVGASQPGTPTGAGNWPDGGSTPTSYVEGGGGGSSRIADGVVPFASINTSSTEYILIGGGGGGGSSYSTSGTKGGSAGYPSGNRGGGYYPADGSVDGRGGTQSAGGAGGSAGRQGSGTAGGKYSGGPANGGGGGGGYYGGGGAGGYYAMGGGGSGYIDAGLSNASSFSRGPGPNHYLGLDDPANSPLKPANAGNTGQPGVVIFKLVSSGD